MLSSLGGCSELKPKLSPPKFQVYADMEELGVRPDEDTTRRIGRAFATSGQEDKEKPVLEKYLKKWKYIHFNGERVRVRRAGPLA
jgi:hypothetical protein